MLHIELQLTFLKQMKNNYSMDILGAILVVLETEDYNLGSKQ